MLDFNETYIEQLALHRVGNKSRDEGFFSSQALFEFDEEMAATLMKYFLPPFKPEEFYAFTHESDLAMNEMYVYCQEIFEDESKLMGNSVRILEHLYNQSDHPRIKNGEVYVCMMKECVLVDEIVEVIGVFKSENKDVFLKPTDEGEMMGLFSEEGINIKKLDKGCLIFNTEKELGYRVLIVDANSSDAQYWRDDFLKLTRIQDFNYYTENYLEMCKDFCEDVYAEETDKKEQVMFMNKSLNYFAQKEEFDLEEFTEEVLDDKPEYAQEFKAYKQQKDEDFGNEAPESFTISQSAVKSMKKKIRSVIRLDTGIEIKLNPANPTESQQHIERGFDEEKEMNFYVVYFHEER